MPPARRPAVVGQFYPADPKELRASIAQYLPKPPDTNAITPHMVMLPHAGYVFCGQVMGDTLAKVRLPQSLILLGPNHTRLGTPLAVWPSSDWLTPLGPVMIDTLLSQDILTAYPAFSPDMMAHAREHSLEVLLPFLQVHTPGFTMAAIAVGTGDTDILRGAGEALARIIAHHKEQGQNVAMVVSSDMHHFSDHESTLALDEKALAALLSLDPDALLRTVCEEKISMCGVCPAVMALHACKALGSTKATLVRHETSGPVSGDMQRVVGYAGLYIS